MATNAFHLRVILAISLVLPLAAASRVAAAGDRGGAPPAERSRQSATPLPALDQTVRLPGSLLRRPAAPDEALSKDPSDGRVPERKVFTVCMFVEDRPQKPPPCS